MNAVPRLSVIIATRNVAGMLEETLASVAAQTYRDFEAIAVDYGSTDATPELLAMYADRWPWFRWECQDNPGNCAASLNRAIESARGEFIAMLDAGDIWLPDKLALQLALFARNPSAACVYADEIDFPSGADSPRTLFQAKPPARGRILLELFMGNFVQTSTVVVRKAALLEVGGLNPGLQVYEDVDLFMRLAERFEFDYVDEVLMRRRILHEHLTLDHALVRERRDLEIFDYWVKRRPDLFPEDAPHVRQRRAAVYARMGRTLLSQQDYAGAREAYRNAIALGQRGPGVLARAAAAHAPMLARLFRLATAARKQMLRDASTERRRK